MPETEIEIKKVDEAAAQRLADATGKIVYWTWFYPCRMTTDREEAVRWGESVAFVPRPQRKLTRQEYGDMARDIQQQLVPHMREMERAVWEDGKAGEPCDYANKTTIAPAGAAGITLGEHPAWVMNDGTERPVEWEPEPQLRVVRVLEYRGPQSWVEKTLANSVVTPLKPFVVSSVTPTSGNSGSPGEITEQLRTRERLCQHCGGEHLGSLSEDECSANERKGRY